MGARVYAVEIHEDRDLVDRVEWQAIQRQTPEHGYAEATHMSQMGDDPIRYSGGVILDYDDGLALFAHIGPKPEFPGMADLQRLRSAHDTQ